jgi:hypothetical protein
VVGGEKAALSDLFPEIFQRLGAGPCTLKVGEIVVEIVGVDGAVGSVEVIEEVECSGCGIPEDVAIEIVDVGVRDSLDDLFLQVGFNGSILGIL